MAKASDPKNQQLNLAEQQTDDIIIEETDLANVGQHEGDAQQDRKSVV